MNFKKIKKVGLISTLTLGLLLSVGCSNTKNSEEKVSSSKETLTIKTYDVDVSYDKVPDTIVSLNSHTTENILALELGDKLIGTAYNNGEISDEYKSEVEKIEVIAEKYPSMEVLLGVSPEFVYGRSSAFSEKGVATVNDMVDNGIMPYVSKATYTDNATMEDVYEDFENLGKIFDIEEKSNNLINEMKNNIKSVQEKLSSINDKKTVFVYDSGEEQAFTAGKSLQTHLIELAGGQNIFNDLDKSWENVNWETVAQRNPEYIVINDYAGKTFEEKVEFLKSHPVMKDLDAVKNDKFILMPLASTFAGIQNDNAVELMAKGLYSEVFEK